MTPSHLSFQSATSEAKTEDKKPEILEELNELRLHLLFACLSSKSALRGSVKSVKQNGNQTHFERTFYSIAVFSLHLELVGYNLYL